MTNAEQDTRKAVAESTVTKIQGQPTNQDLDRLDEELTAIASSFPSDLGGGLHGHAGLVKSAADYALFAPGTPFVVPPNPGFYPQGPIPAAQRSQREAEHKGLLAQFHTCVGVSKGLKDLILQAIDKDFLLEIWDEGIAYLNVSPLQMLTQQMGHDRFRRHHGSLSRMQCTMECGRSSDQILQSRRQSKTTIGTCQCSN